VCAVASGYRIAFNFGQDGLDACSKGLSHRRKLALRLHANDDCKHALIQNGKISGDLRSLTFIPPFNRAATLCVSGHAFDCVRYTRSEHIARLILAAVVDA
jgi:hypothetical protein